MMRFACRFLLATPQAATLTPACCPWPGGSLDPPSTIVGVPGGLHPQTCRVRVRWVGMQRQGPRESLIQLARRWRGGPALLFSKSGAERSSCPRGSLSLGFRVLWLRSGRSPSPPPALLVLGLRQRRAPWGPPRDEASPCPLFLVCRK